MSAPDLYMTTETIGGRRASIGHIIRCAARYGHDMAGLDLETPDLMFEWTAEGRIKVFNRAKPRRRWRLSRRWGSGS